MISKPASRRVLIRAKVAVGEESAVFFITGRHEHGEQVGGIGGAGAAAGDDRVDDGVEAAEETEEGAVVPEQGQGAEEAAGAEAADEQFVELRETFHDLTGAGVEVEREQGHGGDADGEAGDGGGGVEGGPVGSSASQSLVRLTMVSNIWWMRARRKAGCLRRRR